MDETQFFTWEALTTIGGSSLLTYFVVQYTKNLIDKYLSVPTDVYSVFVSFIILMAAQLATGADYSDWRNYALAFANSFLVAAAAGHIQAKAINPPSMKGGE